MFVLLCIFFLRLIRITFYQHLKAVLCPLFILALLPSSYHMVTIFVYLYKCNVKSHSLYPFKHWVNKGIFSLATSHNYKMKLQLWCQGIPCPTSQPSWLWSHVPIERWYTTHTETTKTWGIFILFYKHYDFH